MAAMRSGQGQHGRAATPPSNPMNLRRPSFNIGSPALVPPVGLSHTPYRGSVIWTGL